MENLHAFAAEGCRLEGLCTITRRETRWGDEEPTEVQGIRFSLKDGGTAKSPETR